MTHQSGGWWPVSEWEFREAMRKMREVDALPKGQRWAARKAIAREYGVSLRTLYRWRSYEVQTLRCGKFEALFIIGSLRPSQVTPWEKAA